MVIAKIYPSVKNSRDCYVDVADKSTKCSCGKFNRSFMHIIKNSSIGLKNRLRPVFEIEPEW